MTRSPPLARKSLSVAEQELWKKSLTFFEKGMKDFEAIGDSTNTALLLCNTGRLMRICAQAHCATSADRSRGEFSREEALYYNKVPSKPLQSHLNHIYLICLEPCLACLFLMCHQSLLLLFI